MVESRDVKVYSVVEVDRLMDAIEPWWRPLVLLAADSGMRWGELMGLRVSDFTVGFKSVHVRQVLIEVSKADTGNGTPYMIKPRPKNKKNRLVALSPEVSVLIARLVDDRCLEADDRIFSMPDRSKARSLRTTAWPNGQPVGRSYFREYIWKPAHERTKIEPRRFHDLRGSHITWLLGGNADIATVMKRVGHSQLSTTQLYLAAMTDADDRALEALRLTRLRYRGGPPVDEQ
jgi:integrase